jgi:hypothetical protein
MRRYSNDARCDAALIAAECITQGKSTGWSGDDATAADLTERERILAPYNVHYVDDMRGEWRHLPARR